MKLLKLTKLQSNLEIAIQKSEIMRALILAGISLMIALYLFVRSFIDLAQANLRLDILIPSLALFGVYELVFYGAMKSLQKKDLRLPIFGRVMNSSIEVAFCFLVSAFALEKIQDATVFSFPMLFFPFILIMLSILRMDAVMSVWVGLFSGISWVLFYLHEQAFGLALNGFQLSRAFIYVLMGFVAAFISVQLKRNLDNSIRAGEEKSNILHVFGQHVSPSVVNKLLSQGAKEEGESRKVSVMFLDIRSFTAFSESKQPEEVVKFLNSVFDFMIDRINGYGGLVNKFLGDGFMAIFGAPIDDAHASQNAVLAATEIIKELTARIASGQVPAIKIGIGIHTGQAMTGQIGSQSRKEYTIIGDAVNLASRVESLNKELKTTLLVTEETYGELPGDKFGLKSLGQVEIRGRVQKIEVFGY